jgi:hypothetical protein
MPAQVVLARAREMETAMHNVCQTNSQEFAPWKENPMCGAHQNCAFFFRFGIDLAKPGFVNAGNNLINNKDFPRKCFIYKKLARLVLNTFSGAGAPPVCTDNLQ